MAATVQSVKALDQSTWDIKKDSFILPPTRRLVRGWDRAPVVAHAPRLYGRKVWKKPTKGNKTDQMSEEVQQELQREGAGARKKSRMMGTRENIGNAIWKDTDSDACKTQKSESASCGQGGDSSMIPTQDGHENNAQCSQACSLPVGSMPELHFVPRKRTNTNHVITPKTKLRQTTLNLQTQPLAERVNGSSTPSKRPRKSTRKSLLAGIAEDNTQQISARTKGRRSSRFEPLLTNKPIHSTDFISDPNISDMSGTRRRSRRSAATAMHSISALEIHVKSQDVESHDIGSTSTDVLTALVPEQAPLPKSPDSVTTSLQEPARLDTSFKEANSDAATIDTPNVELSDQSERSAENPDLVDSSQPLISEETYVIHKQKQDIAEEMAPGGDGMIQIQAWETSEQVETTPDVMDSIEKPVSHSRLIENCETSSAEQASPARNGTALVADPDILSPTTSKDSDSPEPKNAGLHTRASVLITASSKIILSQEDKERIEQSQASDPKLTTSTELSLSGFTASAYDYDDTDMLRSFLTRVKANKAARKSPRRKRSLPHSPLRLPLGTLDNNLSPSPPQSAGETAISDPSPLRGKRKGNTLGQEGGDSEPRSIRRSGRTRLPVKEPPAVPSFIPVRRLGQDLDTTITLKRSEEKELAALTRVNTRKNKGNALSAMEVLAKKAEEKDDPVMRQRLLKEVFEEKMEKSKQNKDKKGREKKVVTWAEEIARFQNLARAKVDAGQDEQEKEKVAVSSSGEEKRSSAVRVGIRSKGGLGGALNGTPAPKRKMRGVGV